MNAFIAIDADTVRTQVLRLREQYPELAEDDDLALDMFEGETDLLKVVARAVNERAEAETIASAIKERQSALADRRARYERKGEAMRAIIQSLMEATGQEKITLPEATVTVTSPRVSVNVTDLDALPQGFYRTRKEADKTALKAALMAGEEIPGAEMQFGEPGLTIRTR
jgi:hypothetical protein